MSTSDKRFFILSIVITMVVFAVVVILNFLPQPSFVPNFVKHLPVLNAFINGTCTILLLASLYFIKKKNIPVHKKINITTFLFSSSFLVSYIIYHYFSEETKFPENNPFRPLYLFILLTHIVLAGLILPFILMSFYFGMNMNTSSHKKIVRWTYPIWLYVTITGVIIYLMISPFYPR